MVFRILTLTVFFVSTYTIGTAQEYKSEIEREFFEYMNSIIRRDFEKSMDYILPEFFEIIPKSQMISLMEMTFNNPSVEFELKEARILTIEDAQEIEHQFYALLTYSNQMNMKFINEDDETRDEKTARINMLKLSMEQTFGSENVNYNDDTEFFEVLVEKKVFAISSNGLTDWKFLVVEKKQKLILEKLLPKEITSKI